MSIVGTRPPLISETNLYEPRHKATDTPPYCNEKGGVVLNAAILLNGQEPIEVELRKLPENHIEFASLDLDAHGVVTTAAEIQDCHNPYDSFALHKAALITKSEN